MHVAALRNQDSKLFRTGVYQLMRDNEQRARGCDSAVIEAIGTKGEPLDIQHHDDVVVVAVPVRGALCLLLRLLSKLNQAFAGKHVGAPAHKEGFDDTIATVHTPATLPSIAQTIMLCTLVKLKCRPMIRFSGILLSSTF